MTLSILTVFPDSSLRFLCLPFVTYLHSCFSFCPSYSMSLTCLKRWEHAPSWAWYALYKSYVYYYSDSQQPLSIPIRVIHFRPPCCSQSVNFSSRSNPSFSPSVLLHAWWSSHPVWSPALPDAEQSLQTWDIEANLVHVSNVSQVMGVPPDLASGGPSENDNNALVRNVGLFDVIMNRGDQ